MPHVLAKKNLHEPQEKHESPWAAAHAALKRRDRLKSIEATHNGVTVKLTLKPPSYECIVDIQKNIKKLRASVKAYSESAPAIYKKMNDVLKSNGSNWNHTFQAIQCPSKTFSLTYDENVSYSDQQLTARLMDLIFSDPGTKFLPPVNAVVFGTKKSDDLNPYRIICDGDEVRVEARNAEVGREVAEVSQEAAITEFLTKQKLVNEYTQCMVDAYDTNMYSGRLLGAFQIYPVKIEIDGRVVQKGDLDRRMMRAIILCIAKNIGYNLSKITQYHLIFKDDEESEEEESEEEESEEEESEEYEEYRCGKFGPEGETDTEEGHNPKRKRKREEDEDDEDEDEDEEL